ncbi:MAG: hypothetical protein UZ17_ACD001002185 [Acidobacteria bacterium OLB17]|nr:MAG: hypothetical protein UZ17_ACD001002185 [Acidobacteria bacterium OLB17]
MSFFDNGGGSGRVSEGSIVLGWPGAPGRTTTGPLLCPRAVAEKAVKLNNANGKDTLAHFDLIGTRIG